MTYHSQCPGYNPKLFNIKKKKKEKQSIFKKKDNEWRLPNNFKAATTMLKDIKENIINEYERQFEEYNQQCCKDFVECQMGTGLI